MKLPFSKEWKNSEGAQMIKDHRNKKRATWLWDDEGENLIWRNDAARLFLAKRKHKKLKFAKPVTPIPGQIRRLLRLGNVGLSSLAQVRFVSGTKPVSATCSCTPVELENGQTALLIACVDPIKGKYFKQLKQPDPHPGTLFAGSKSIKKRKRPADKNPKGKLSHLAHALSNGSKLFDPLELDEEIDARELVHVMPTDPKIKADVLLEPQTQWRITGQDFVAFESEKIEQSLPSKTSNVGEPTSKSEEVERAATYNFAELGRILGEKVGDQHQNHVHEPSVSIAPTPSNNTINLSQEVLVLNRLPVGILIFRDQEILFVNRALADMVGASSISELKSNGLAAIFPRVEDENSSVGPILSIVGSDGTSIAVDARLQGITWQGGQALMLSAQQKSDSDAPETGPYDAKSFVQAISEARDDGYFEIDRNGTLTHISEQGLGLLELDRNKIEKRPFFDLVQVSQRETFQEFLERPAKTAQTLQPYLELKNENGSLGFEIFTQGAAGIVDGYFGVISPLGDQKLDAFSPPMQGEVATLLLARLSRGIRRPLNTIMGFSELISGQSFGEISNKRYVEYAGDIQTAGEEISHLTDELDEYARLEDEGFTLDADSFDLTKLLDECMGLVRDQAIRHQVFVRSAIPESLPFILADRASLRQALLNLLVSAIAQSPSGGKVILSAQVEDDNSIGVHVRDSSSGPTGIDDRFMVFREKTDNNGHTIVPMTSSMGLALTRSLISVNSCLLHVDPSAGTGTLMSLVIPANLLIPNNTPATN